MTDLASDYYNVVSNINPDKFMCEGVVDKHRNGALKWVPTTFKTSSNNNTIVYRQACTFSANYAVNNKNNVEFYFRGQQHTLVTSPCKRPATLSPTKDCDFRLFKDTLPCPAGTVTSVSVTNSDILALVVRVCESSWQLGHSTYCEYVYSVGTQIIQPNQTASVSFSCPGPRSDVEPGGLVSILISSLLPSVEYTWKTLSIN